MEEWPQYYPPPTGLCHIVAVLHGGIESTAEVMAAASYHWNHRSRLAAALAPPDVLPSDMLSRLAQDANCLVRAVAKLRREHPEQTIRFARGPDLAVWDEGSR
jgi:hypothetical protein